MHHRWAVNILRAKKSLKLLPSRNLCFIPNQSCLTKSTGGCFIPASAHQINTISPKRVQCTPSRHETLLSLLPVRDFSLTKTVFSSGGSNRDEEKRQVLIWGVSLTTAVVLCCLAMASMQYHEDYVIIEPEKK